tara:strand:+ start:169 stop:1554 length:1386 start_codon:yes stop_codon:yes gene_type:complete
MSILNNQNSKVTIYVTSHNYSRFLKESIESVLNQTYKNWELFLIDDGSSDDSFEIMKSYENSIIFAKRNNKALGLRNCANFVLNHANGEYIIRLDADDFFDENAILLMVDFLEKNKKLALVYPDWIYVDEKGKFCGRETRKKIDKETFVYDLAAHGACTMIRTKILKKIGGYDTSLDKQDGYEIWMKIIQNYKVGNINTPLFSYRKHGSSMSSDESKLIESRTKIKNILIKQKPKISNLNNIVIIPIRNKSNIYAQLAFQKFNNKFNFIDKAINDAISSKIFKEIIIETDDDNVCHYVKKEYPDIKVYKRSKDLCGDLIPLSKVIFDVYEKNKKTTSTKFNIICILPIHCPQRISDDIVEAFNTLILNEVDQVISTYEDYDMHFKHSMYGMEPISSENMDLIRYERDALYVNNGAVHMLWSNFIDKNTMYKGKIGHFTMKRERSIQIKLKEDLINYHESKK